MAWTDLGAGPGIWNGLSIAEPAGSSTPDLKQILMELITAVYEREEIMKLAYYTTTGDNYLFRKPDDTLGEGDEFATLADFDGMLIRGESSQYYDNLIRLQSAIEDLVTRTNCIWCPDSTTRDDWISSRAELLNLGTFGSTWLDPDDTDIAGVDVLHQIREALDNLIYPIYGMKMDNEPGATGDKERKRSSTGDFDEQWTNMLAEAWESGGFGGSTEYEATLGCTNGGQAEYTRTNEVSPGKQWLSGNMTGTLLEGIYIVTLLGSVHTGSLQASNAKFTASYSAADFAANEHIAYSQGTSWPPIGTHDPAQETCHVAIPSSNPFTSSGSAQVYAGRRIGSTFEQATKLKSTANIEKYSRAYCELVPGTDLTYG